MKLNEAYKLLNDCSAVIIASDDINPLTYPSLSALTDEPDNEFMYLAWADEGGDVFDVKFKQAHNEEVSVIKNSLVFTDVEGNVFLLTLLAPMSLGERKKGEHLFNSKKNKNRAN